MFTSPIIITIEKIFFCDIMINFNLILIYYNSTTRIYVVVSAAIAIIAYYYIGYILIDLAKLVLIVMISRG